MLDLQEVTEAKFAVYVACLIQNIAFEKNASKRLLELGFDTTQIVWFPTGLRDGIGKSVVHLKVDNLLGVRDLGGRRALDPEHERVGKGKRKIANVPPVLLTPSDVFLPLRELFFVGRPKIAD